MRVRVPVAEFFLARRTTKFPQVLLIVILHVQLITAEILQLFLADSANVAHAFVDLLAMFLQVRFEIKTFVANLAIHVEFVEVNVVDVVF